MLLLAGSAPTRINHFIFALWRGTHQGCPLSPVLFILAIEVLAANLQNTRDLIGIRAPSISDI